ncbi:MAG: helix-turn-helix transcriptional regulator [Aeriscardovia sp.]|nr:helix-turn-helix transcriptional regulator [Aeriscardovia sp.]
MENTLNFKGWAVSRGIKQKDIALILNVSLQTVNNKMNGRKDFTLEDIKKLNAAYGVSADVFLN